MPRTALHYSKVTSASNVYIKKIQILTYIAFLLGHQKGCTHSHSGSLFSIPSYWQQRITNQKSSLVNTFLNSSQAACDKYPQLNSFLRAEKGRTGSSHPTPQDRHKPRAASGSGPAAVPRFPSFTLELTQQTAATWACVHWDFPLQFHTRKTVSGQEFLKISF